MKKKLNKGGFTLVELVIVIAVIAILVAILIPSFSGVVDSANKNAFLSSCRNDLTDQLAQAAGRYAEIPGGDVMEGVTRANTPASQTLVYDSDSFRVEFNYGEGNMSWSPVTVK